MVSIPVSLTRLADPVGNDTLWNYDKRYRVVSEMNELGKYRYFQYDAVGNLTQQTDRNGRVIEFTYDNLDRVTQEQWLGTGARTLTFQYDSSLRLVSASDPGVGHGYGYDALGRVTLETQQINGLDPLAYDRSYDLAGNLLSVAAKLEVTVSQNPGEFPTISGGTPDFVNDYTYDGLNRLTQLLQHGFGSGGGSGSGSGSSSGSGSGGGPANAVAEKRVDFEYNAVHQFTDIDRYQNLTGTQLVAHTDFGYDNLGRLTSIDHLKGATTFSAYDLTYDAASRITAIDDVFSNSAWNETHTYTYDNTDQLTAGNHSVQTDESYGYDSNGNRNTTGYVVGANNRTTSDGTYNYEYDDEGNRTKRTKISNGEYEEYSWDHRNRLTKVVKKSSAHAVLSQVDLTYDVFNHLIKEVIDADGAGSGQPLDRYFSWQDGQIVLQWDENFSTSAIELTHRYLWGPMVDQLLVDEQVSSLSSAGTNYWALTNHVGSVVDVATYDMGIDVTSIVKHRSLNGFGKITSDSAPSISALFAHQGKMFQIVIGLNYHDNRYYDADLGRWISQDPEGFAAGDTNLERAMGNHVVYAIDPDGLQERGPKTPKSTQGELRRGFYHDPAMRPIVEAQDQAYDDGLETAREGQRVMLETAGVGGLVEGVEAATGEDFYSREQLTMWQRFWKFCGFGVGVAGAASAGDELLEGAARVSKTAKRAKTAEKVGDAVDLAKQSALVARIKSKLDLYPKVVDSRTGRYIPFPSGIVRRVDQTARVPWTATERAAFIAEWHRRGYRVPAGGWDKYDIHHIQPREFGGTNDFWNLVPIERGTHQELNCFWREFTEL